VLEPHPAEDEQPQSAIPKRAGTFQVRPGLRRVGRDTHAVIEINATRPPALNQFGLSARFLALFGASRASSSTRRPRAVLWSPQCRAVIGWLIPASCGAVRRMSYLAWPIASCVSRDPGLVYYLVSPGGF